MAPSVGLTLAGAPPLSLLFAPKLHAIFMTVLSGAEGIQERLTKLLVILLLFLSFFFFASIVSVSRG